MILADEKMIPVSVGLREFIPLVCAILNRIKTMTTWQRTNLHSTTCRRWSASCATGSQALESLLTENISRQSAPQENTHVPMTVQEACEYLRMPLSTFYYKVKKDNIPVIKQGKRLYIYRDELDKWLESFRKTPPAQSFEEENEALIASHRRKPKPKNW